MSGRIFSFGMVELNVSLRGDTQHCCLSYSFCHGSEHRCVCADCLLGSIYIFYEAFSIYPIRSKDHIW